MSSTIAAGESEIKVKTLNERLASASKAMFVAGALALGYGGYNFLGNAEEISKYNQTPTMARYHSLREEESDAKREFDRISSRELQLAAVVNDPYLKGRINTVYNNYEKAKEAVRVYQKDNMQNMSGRPNVEPLPIVTIGAGIFGMLCGGFGTYISAPAQRRRPTGRNVLI